MGLLVRAIGVRILTVRMPMVRVHTARVHTARVHTARIHMVKLHIKEPETDVAVDSHLGTSLIRTPLPFPHTHPY